MKNLLLYIGVITLLCLHSHAQTNLWESVGGADLQLGLTTMYGDTTNNLLYVGGIFAEINGVQNLNALASFDGIKWDSLGNGLSWNGSPQIITKYDNNIYVGGSFTNAGNSSANNIAYWDGSEWHALGNGVNQTVVNIKEYDNELYVCGVFDTAGSVAANGLAKWDGYQWSSVYDLPALNGNNHNQILDFTYYNNELYVGGNFDEFDTIGDIIRFDGENWRSVGELGLLGGLARINKMVVYDNMLVVAGIFYKQDGNAGNFIQAWDGLQWLELGGSVYGIYMSPTANAQIEDMLVHNNELYITGYFSYAGGVPSPVIAKWNGVEWCSLGTQAIELGRALTIYRDTLYVSSLFHTETDTINGLAKWVGGDYTDTCGVMNSVEYIGESEKEIIVYPNPASENITIKGIDNSFQDYTVYNDLGQAVLSGKLNNSNIIQIRGIRKGIYLIVFNSDNSICRAKFLKQ